MNLIRKIKSKMIYSLSIKDLCIGILEALCWIIATAILFYDSLLPVILFLPYIHWHLIGRYRKLDEKKKRQLNMQFKDGMLSISSYLAAGYSIENAFNGTAKELENLYGQESDMAKEFLRIVQRTSCNEKIEEAIEDMANQVDLEDARYFAAVFGYVKKSGGNLVEIMKKTADTISQKIMVKNDIDVMISGKKMEQNVMNFMPYMIIAYLRFGSYEFIAPMYGNLLGITVMTLCLGGYIAARKIAERIISISV